MIDTRFPKPETITLKELDNFNEAKLRDIIGDDPTILGLGELVVRSIEKTQTGAGRLDMLLGNPNDDKRYEVELQFGKTDESHIIRCLEYWDIERRRYPQYDHTAVLVAEDITSRFLNVISLFNGCVPLIALKLTAFKFNDQIILSFVKVLDKVVREEEPLQDPPGANRAFWVEKSSENMVSVVDAPTSSCRSIIRDISAELDLKYNQQYIGIQENGVSNVFTYFVPFKKGFVRVYVRLRSSDMLDDWVKRLTEAGLAAVARTGDEWLNFQLITKQDLELKERQDLLKEMFKSAYEMTK
jgi:hypothetical protein